MLKYKIEVEENKTKTTDLNIIKWKKTITDLQYAIKEIEMYNLIWSHLNM